MSDANILFLGDFGVSNPKNISIGQNLQNEIDTADIVGVNFEGCINRGEIISPTKKAIPQSDVSAKWCCSKGIKLFSLANNHIMDFGEEGFISTLKLFPKESIIFGAGKYNEAYSPAFININGISIGFLGGTSADFSSFKTEWDDNEKFGCAWVKSPKFTLSILEAKQKCDHLFVICHAGAEYMNLPLPEWRELYRSWIDIGASAVIASHPHVPQGIENYKGHPIYYSLGNFIFEGTSKKSTPQFWNNSIGAKIKISRNEIVEFNFLPLVYNNNICDVDLSIESISHIDNLCEILSNDSVYMDTLNRNIPQLADKYNSYLLSSMNAVKVDRDFKTIKRFLKAFLQGHENNKALLHQLREESTTYTMCRNLKNITKSYL